MRRRYRHRRGLDNVMPSVVKMDYYKSILSRNAACDLRLKKRYCFQFFFQRNDCADVSVLNEIKLLIVLNYIIEMNQFIRREYKLNNFHRNNDTKRWINATDLNKLIRSSAGIRYILCCRAARWMTKIVASRQLTLATLLLEFRKKNMRNTFDSITIADRAFESSQVSSIDVIVAGESRKFKPMMINCITL